VAPEWCAAEPGPPETLDRAPEISAHLLAATPTRHWLEWVDWAEAILDEP